MGLDMYLTGQRYLSSYVEEDKKVLEQLKNILGSELEIEGVDFKIITWRKANAIHQWFVDNVQDGEDDCGTYYVSEEQLQELLTLVTEVLKAPQEKWGEMLPTQEGFFFGDNEYGENYKDDLEQTKAGLEKFLASKEAGNLDVHYHSSW